MNFWCLYMNNDLGVVTIKNGCKSERQTSTQQQYGYRLYVLVILITDTGIWTAELPLPWYDVWLVQVQPYMIPIFHERSIVCGYSLMLYWCGCTSVMKCTTDIHYRTIFYIQNSSSLPRFGVYSIYAGMIFSNICKKKKTKKHKN